MNRPAAETVTDRIRADLYRVVPQTLGVSSLFRGLRNQGFRYLLFARLNAATNSVILRFILKRFVRRYTYKFGFQIPVANIGGGLLIGHFGPVIVSEHAIIGRDCNIAHNVTIGVARGRRAGAPRIGDRVWIGAGAVLVGSIDVGSDVLIAPNAYVNFDVAAGYLVIGNPGKVFSKVNASNEYVNNTYYR